MKLWLNILLLTHICILYDLINMFDAINQYSTSSWTVKLLNGMKFNVEKISNVFTIYDFIILHML